MTEEQKEHGLIFSGPMAKANVEGRKSMTRRIISPYNSRCTSAPYKELDFNNVVVDGKGYATGYLKVHMPEDDTRHRVFCRYWPDDLIWQRETWQTSYENEKWIPIFKTHGYYVGEDESVKWKPSIHLKKEYARYWAKIISVRPERLQDISEYNAIKEGVERNRDGSWHDYLDPQRLSQDSAKASFQSLWLLLHGRKSWDDNPWLWVITYETFSKIDKPKNE